MKRQHFKLGEILVKEGLVTEEQIAKALQLQKKNFGESLGRILVSSKVISEEDLVITLSKQLNIPYASREKGLLTPSREQELDKLVPEDFSRKNCVLPLSRHENSLTVALSDPLDLVLLDNLRAITGCNINPVIATRTDIEAGLTDFYGEGGMLEDVIRASYNIQEGSAEPEQRGFEERLSLDDLVASAEKAPVINLTDLLIREAIRMRASDIHIEPFYDTVSIRFRVDGVLHLIAPPDKSMLLPLVSRLKILSKLDIAEKRLPQDGSFRATIQDKLIDFRVSTIPTIYGEKMVLRILDRSSVTLNLEALGFNKDELTSFRKAIRKPHGLVLVTGPTGSGKTTTLYAALNEIKGDDKNITTIEDPVEYQMPGINQVQVKPSIGLTFSSGLRAFLRQDPDIMLVGETRDLETAQICIRAALTGHLVFSTLHTNDAPSALNRLVDIGIEPYLVASSLHLVMAQRLVRRLCPKCKESYPISGVLLPEKLKSEAAKTKVFYKSIGCEACGKTGYLGRMAIYEIMGITPRIEQLVLQKASSAEVHDEACRSGMVTLEESGYRKVIAGDTSVEEVLRVAMSNVE